MKKVTFITLTLFSISLSFASEDSTNGTTDCYDQSLASTLYGTSKVIFCSKDPGFRALRNKRVRSEIFNYFATEKISPILRKEINKIMKTFSKKDLHLNKIEDLEKRAIQVIAKRNKL
jgi:hypothetical protein